MVRLRTKECDGKIDYYEGGVHVRTEYAEGHKRHGEICYLDQGVHVRTEYAKKHRKHGRIEFLQEGVHVRIEYAKGHKRHGRKLKFRGPRHGEILHFAKDGMLNRIEYGEGHPSHGEPHYGLVSIEKVRYRAPIFTGPATPVGAPDPVYRLVEDMMRPF